MNIASTKRLAANSIPANKTPSRIAGWSFVLTVVAVLLGGVSAPANEIVIDNLETLAQYAGESGNHIKMEPGLYRMTDYIPLEKIPERKAEGQYEFITFTGNDNVFDLSGVILTFDTKLRSKLDPPIHTPEFVLSGNNNVLKGLTIVNIGDGTSNHGNVFTVHGDSNTMRDCTFIVRGSSPYGYGDWLGTGGRKHSGVRITGDNTSIIGCSIYMRSFGHAFYLQDGPENTHFEDCYVEGELRLTDDIRAETSGPLYEVDFRSERGEIESGHIVSLAEDAFRIYSAGKVSFVNCTAKNMRKGFDVRTGGPAHMDNCVAIGISAGGFQLGHGGDVIKNSRGDAKYGPLLQVLDDGGGGYASVNLELMPDVSELKGWRHDEGVARISGETGSKVSISPWEEKERDSAKAIHIGWRREASDHTLINNTTMPVKITERASDCTVETKGEVLQNEGMNIETTRIEP